ncbi:MAG TPA: hypothetical protein VK934_08000 [Fimbriimonas sp.]|nr:hypothetical protein [Fimbriimonas sp.]
MKKLVKLSLAIMVGVVGVNMIAGCGPASDDKALETAAPPPSADAVAEPGRDKPNRPGAMGAAGGGGAAPAAAGAGEAIK